jgi:hypothetical protein
VQRFLRAGGIALLSGLVGGLVWGIGARAAMRVVALAVGQRPEFSWEGTFMIVAATAFAGAVTGLGYLLPQQWVRGGWFRKGLILGGLVLLIHGYLLYQSPPFQSELAQLGHDALPITVALFAPLLINYGIIVAATYTWLDRRLLLVRHGRLATWFGITLLLLPVIYEAGIGALIYLVATGRLQL